MRPIVPCFITRFVGSRPHAGQVRWERELDGDVLAAVCALRDGPSACERIDQPQAAMTLLERARRF